ncbi:hypothetical protein CJ030_MR5G009680 [Morella rubra]|uniref:Uncharacterized protein n=1 Tax=Morella rubra TaxID=262757 RepID=A0A6A1VLF4_9ROSI|nr:hypothetical protein CJ030_MR5G009680 [Morella rubra]
MAELTRSSSPSQPDAVFKHSDSVFRLSDACYLMLFRRLADAEQSSTPALSLEQHTAIIMSHTIIVERHIQLSDFYNILFEDQTLPKVVEQASWLLFLQRTSSASKNMVREFYAAILRATNLEKPSMEVTVRNIQDHVSNPMLHHRPKEAYDGPVLWLSRVIVPGRSRRQEQPEGQDPPQSSTQGLRTEQQSWAADVMMELTEQMRSIMLPTDQMGSDICAWLTALESKVGQLDLEWRREVAAVWSDLTSMVSGAQLHALTERVVLIEEHMCRVQDALELAEDE